MDLRQLRYFLAVAKEKHFGRAAQALNIVQPALSMQIRALEEELGGALFERTSRRVELTEAGKVFETQARRTLAQAEFTRESTQRALRGETGIVRIGFAGNAIFSGTLMRDLRHFHHASPEVEISLEEMTPRRQVEAIQAGLLDIGYSPDHSALRQPDLHAEKIGEWGMLVAMADDHPLASAAEITLAMLAHEALILYEAHDADEQLSVLLAKALGEKLNIAHRTGSSLNVLAIAASGLGVALVPVPLHQVSVPGLIYRTLNAPELTANLLVISRKKESSPAVKAWLAQVNDRGD
ncbi:LysR substrate-binding domain-containing protein [Enterobacteriaceae bacterium C34A]